MSRFSIDALKLMVGVVLTSTLNLYIYVFRAFKDVDTTYNYFIESNYVAGIYLFGVVSSVSTITTYALNKSNYCILAKYLKICIVLWLFCLIFVLTNVNPIGSLLCLIASLLMLVAGININCLIFKSHTFSAGILPIVNPIVTIIALYIFGHDNNLRWVLSYLSGSFVLFILTLAVSRNVVLEISREIESNQIKYSTLIVKMFSTVSFALFLQIDLIIAGTTRGVLPGYYSIVQKVFSSVATAFSSLVPLIYTRVNKFSSSLTPVAAISLVICISVVILGYLAKSAEYNIFQTFPELLFVATVSGLYYISIYVNFYATANHVRIALSSLLTGFLLYFTFIRVFQNPDNLFQNFAPSFIFFVAYTVVALVCILKKDKLKKIV